MMKSIDLNGTWQLHWNDGHRGDAIDRLWSKSYRPQHAVEAHVPGEIHLDLIRAGLLQEPSIGVNCLAARWVEEMFWYYRKAFSAPQLQAGERAWLVFEALDLCATVYLNHQKVGEHHNAFYPCRIDVTDFLQPGENLLVVTIESGLFSVADRPSVIGGNIEFDILLHKRNWLRKTQSSFGWDWATRLLNVGITGGVKLEIASGVRFERLVALPELSAGLDRGTVTVRAFVEGLGGTPQSGTLLVEIAGTGQKKAVEVLIQPGEQALETVLEIENPDLWWPVGHGAQPLYTVQAELIIAGQPVGAGQRRVGFRHIRVNQSPHPKVGQYFIVEINQKPIFIKGANFVPADMILQRLDRQRYATLVERALEANFNLLRVWGGGLYESDDLYDLCDERGLLVWQEFIFACAKYPATDANFLADVKNEATYQVRRLAHHPSLIVWCGNNEIEEGYYGWGYEKGTAFPDYSLYHMVLPVLLKKEDGTRYYQPSSPFSPDNEPPRRDDIGDQHPWTVGFMNTDFRDYREMICRFPNEGGILGPNALPTVKACLVPGQEHPGSFAWQVHDNAFTFTGDHCATDDMLVQWLGKSIDEMTLEEYVYYGGVVQGHGQQEYIRNFRRRMFDSASAVFWMYNDCWPTVRSWTIVDYYLRRTPSFYPVRRAFKPLTVAVVHEEDKIKVFGINEGNDWEGELGYGLLALAGGYPVNHKKAVRLPGNASTLLAELDGAEWTRQGETTHVAFAVLSQGGQEAARDCLFLPYYKEMVWPKAEVHITCQDGKAIFTCDTFAWRVCLDLDGEQALPDNFFDIYPGIPTILDWDETLGEPRVLHVGNLA
jgi:beta-mannosidase